VKQNTYQLRNEAVITDLSGKTFQFTYTDISGEECNWTGMIPCDSFSPITADPPWI